MTDSLSVRQTNVFSLCSLSSVPGVGIVLITVSGIAWRLTSQDGPSCRAMLGLSSYQDYGDGRFLTRPAYPRGTVAASHPYAGMMYQEFQYRPPPPSYQASMQEYRLRLLLMDRTGGPPPPPPPVMSPPPAYRSSRSGLATCQESPSRPPSYRSRASDRLPVPIHARHPSQLSYLSFAGAREPALVEEEPKEGVQHASVVPVIPCPGNKASIRISADMDQYMTNIQDQFDKISNKTEKNCGSEGVTIVTNSSSVGQYPVVVTVSGQVDSQEDSQSQGKVDITAHL